MQARSTTRDDGSRPASWLWLSGRILLALLFAVSGLMKFAFASQVAQGIASKGLPMPEVLAYLAGTFEVGAALALIAGYRLAETSILLALYSLLTAVLFHNFWAVSPAEQQVQLPNFLKNLALAGAFLIISGIAREDASRSGGAPRGAEWPRKT